MLLAGPGPEGGTRPRAEEEVHAVDANAPAHDLLDVAVSEVAHGVDEVALFMHPDVAALQATELAPMASSCRMAGAAFTTSDRR